MNSVRDTFFNRIYELIKQGEDIVVITSDLGAPSLDDLRKYFPERYVSVGIAEQNLLTISAGLSLSGKKVIAYGLNPFPVTRAFDQMRTLMGELKIPFTLCGLNAGLCSAESGYTHMPVEDMGMVRMLPGIKIINPSDETISRMTADISVKCSIPIYVRFDKTIRGTIYNEHEIDFSKGFHSYKDNTENLFTIVTQGYYVQELRKLIDDYNKKGVSANLIDLFSLPLDEKKLADKLKNSMNIITVEENVLACGIGSMILEVLSDYKIMVPVKRLGLNVKNGYYNVFTDRTYIGKNQRIDFNSVKAVADELIG